MRLPAPGCRGHTAAPITHDRAAVRSTHRQSPRPACVRRPPPRTAPARCVLRAGLSQTPPALPLRLLPLAQSTARTTREPLPRSPSTLWPVWGLIISPQSPARVRVGLRPCREASRHGTEMGNHTHGVREAAQATTDADTCTRYVMPHTRPASTAPEEVRLRNGPMPSWDVSPGTEHPVPRAHWVAFLTGLGSSII